MAKAKTKEELVRELANKVRRGELTPEEAKAEVLKAGLHHRKYECMYLKIVASCTVVGGLLCFLPFIANHTGWAALNYFTRLPAIEFPLVVKIAFSVFCIALFAAGMYAMRLRTKKGGTRDEDEPIILIKEGPYAIIRHPNVLGFLALFSMFTVVASGTVPFTVFSVVGNVLFLTGFYYETRGEDKLNVIKWGDEYRRYMNEVPSFNLFLGIWRWARRKH